MAGMQTVAEGMFCALVSNGYDFVDRTTGERRVGTSHRLYVAPADVRPIEIAVTDGSPMIPDLAALEPGEVIRCSCTVFANGSGERAQLQPRLDSFELAVAL